MKRNYSQVVIQNYPISNRFLTSNLKDYKHLNLKSDSEIKSESELVKKRIKFICSIHINLGVNKPEKQSMYNYNFIVPINHKQRFDYSKINFRYNSYNIDPIIQKLGWKYIKRMNGFDYFSKDKRYKINKNNSFIKFSEYYFGRGKIIFIKIIKNNIFIID